MRERAGGRGGADERSARGLGRRRARVAVAAAAVWAALNGKVGEGRRRAFS